MYSNDEDNLLSAEPDCPLLLVKFAHVGLTAASITATEMKAFAPHSTVLSSLFTQI